MDTWNLKELTNCIGDKYGGKQRKTTLRSLDSIFENQDFSRFHYFEIKDLISEHMINNQSGSDYLKLVINTDIIVRGNEHQFSTSCKAHIIALLRQMHSIPDLLAHVIYYCFGFNLSNETCLDAQKVSLFNVKQILKKDSIYSELLELLNSLTANEDFKYLKDLGNYIKHRANVVPKLSYSMQHEGEKVYKFTFDAFESYPEVPAIDFLNREYNRQSEQIISIGNELNALVAK
ncbi:hypothetical protein FM038_007200 [Shewanella eurypsychrophilus]|uniref:Uncharacterized protein n=1 Tax=Shewanella eurypsychrophilus TaxID=2593656 RepID=A0ABX6V4F7_9GAMM|nr:MULTISPECIES: hypothetical protein [Shewanella]QFU21960.1 hypothetical protein FS418_08780 [Shewanella sp. YLB-09]QPG57249.1 hypothetical protein FM038_007200 [Shewanella eurypsychrophilus]